MSQQLPKLMTREEVAKYLGVSLPTVWRYMVRDHVLPFVRVGKRQVRFRAEDVAAYVKKQTNKQMKWSAERHKKAAEARRRKAEAQVAEARAKAAGSAGERSVASGR